MIVGACTEGFVSTTRTHRRAGWLVTCVLDPARDIFKSHTRPFCLGGREAPFLGAGGFGFAASWFFQGRRRCVVVRPAVDRPAVSFGSLRLFAVFPRCDALNCNRSDLCVVVCSNSLALRSRLLKCCVAVKEANHIRPHPPLNSVVCLPVHDSHRLQRTLGRTA